MVRSLLDAGKITFFLLWKGAGWMEVGFGKGLAMKQKCTSHHLGELVKAYKGYGYIRG
jgi:hypothetical protein